VSPQDASAGLTPLFGRDTSGGLTPGWVSGRDVAASRPQGLRGRGYSGRGEWSDDGNTLEGEWEYLGGGYKETMTRVA
jgi:hypothetical protein